MNQADAAVPAETIESTGKRFFDVLALAATVIGIIAIPLGIAFNREQAPLGLPLEVALTVIFAIDAVLAIRHRLKASPAENTGFLGWIRVACDVLAAVPWARLTGIPLLDALRLAKITRLIPFLFMPGGENAANTTAMRILGFIVVFGLTTHAISGLQLVLQEPVAPENATDAYVNAIYWTIGALTSFDYGGNIESITMQDRLLAAGIMMVGLFAYAYLIGLFAHLLLNLDVARASHSATQEMLEAFMKDRDLPEDIQQRVLGYHEYIWKRRHGLDEASVLADLPPSLRDEVGVLLKQNLINRISFLEDVSDTVARELAFMLKPIMFTPGDEVVRKDDKGHSMYFVGHGELEVLDANGNVINTLGPGDLFGEMALISDAPRTATVRAKDYCDLYELASHDFDHAIARHPEFAAHVYKLAEERKKY